MRSRSRPGLVARRNRGLHAEFLSMGYRYLSMSIGSLFVSRYEISRAQGQGAGRQQLRRRPCAYAYAPWWRCARSPRPISPCARRLHPCMPYREWTWTSSAVHVPGRRCHWPTSSEATTRTYVRVRAWSSCTHPAVTSLNHRAVALAVRRSTHIYTRYFCIHIYVPTTAATCDVRIYGRPLAVWCTSGVQVQPCCILVHMLAWFTNPPSCLDRATVILFVTALAFLDTLHLQSVA